MVRANARALTGGGLMQHRTNRVVALVAVAAMALAITAAVAGGCAGLGARWAAIFLRRRTGA